MAPASLADPASITGYHAHIYYDAASKPRAEGVRSAMEAAFPQAQFGRWHDNPIGPHPMGSYQVAFSPAALATILPWLLLNRDGLIVFLHPETGREVADHTAHATW